MIGIIEWHLKDEKIILSGLYHFYGLLLLRLMIFHLIFQCYIFMNFLLSHRFILLNNSAFELEIGYKKVFATLKVCSHLPAAKWVADMAEDHIERHSLPNTIRYGASYTTVLGLRTWWDKYYNTKMLVFWGFFFFCLLGPKMNTEEKISHSHGAEPTLQSNWDLKPSSLH